MIKRASWLALTLAVLLLGSGVQAQRSNKNAAIKLRVRGRQLVLTAAGRTHLLKLADDKIDAAKLESAQIIFVSRRPEFTYLLVDACGQSKLKQDARHCGLGTECNLLWLKLTPAWRVAEARSARYMSCWYPTSNEEFQVKGRTLSVAYSNYHTERKVQFSYDAEQPERGFTLAESPLPAN